MRIILTTIIILFCIMTNAQGLKTPDSLDVTILNKGKYYIKKYVLTVDGQDYKFSDVWKKEYSDYQRLPYIWPNNKSETTVIIRHMIKYDRWMTSEKMPIDHIGDSKLTVGSYTIDIRTKRRKDNLDVEETVSKDNK